LELGFNLHVSGDYKSATDKLNIDFSKGIFTLAYFKQNLPADLFNAISSVLYEQNLKYPSNYASRLKRDLPEYDLTPDGKDYIIE